MKCPHCSYEERIETKSGKYKDSKQGNFFYLPIKLGRNQFYDKEERTVYGCPNCLRMFMSDYCW